jgi:hypothetical protein
MRRRLHRLRSVQPRGSGASTSSETTPLSISTPLSSIASPNACGIVLAPMASKQITKLEDLTPDQRNANRGTQRGRALLENSMRRVGAARSIVADKHGNVPAGNKTLEVAVELGFGVKVVKTSGRELVVVQREDLDLNDPNDTRARELAFLDNRVAELDLDYDPERLLEAAEDGIDLDAVGFREEEVEEIVGAAAEESARAQVDGESSTIAEDVRFHFGTYRGLVSPDLYRKFIEQYNRVRQNADAESEMIDDVLRAWLQL